MKIRKKNKFSPYKNILGITELGAIFVLDKNYELEIKKNIEIGLG